MPAEQAQQQYSALLQEIDAYLKQMDVPPAIIELMKRTPSTQARLLSGDEINQIGERPPGIMEWLTSSCGRLPDGTAQLAFKLMSSSRPQDRKTGQELSDRIDTQFACNNEKIMVERSAAMLRNASGK